MKHLVLLAGIILLAVPVSAQESILSGGWAETSETRLYPEETLEMRSLMTSPETLGANIYGRYRGGQLHTIALDYTGSLEMSPLGVIIEEDQAAFVWGGDIESAIESGFAYVWRTFDEFVFASLAVACQKEIVATEIEIKAEAGIHFIATFVGTVSIKYEMAKVCPQVLEKLAEAKK